MSNEEEVVKEEPAKVKAPAKAHKEEAIDVKAEIEKAVKSARSEWEAQQQEAERLSKLSEDEKRIAKLQAKEKELNLRTKELNRKEAMADLKTELTSRNLAVGFSEFLLTDDSRKTLDNLNNFEKLFKQAVEEATNEKLKGTPPIKSVPDIEPIPVSMIGTFRKFSRR